MLRSPTSPVSTIQPADGAHRSAAAVYPSSVLRPPPARRPIVPLWRQRARRSRQFGATARHATASRHPASLARHGRGVTARGRGHSPSWRRGRGRAPCRTGRPALAGRGGTGGAALTVPAGSAAAAAAAAASSGRSIPMPRDGPGRAGRVGEVREAAGRREREAERTETAGRVEGVGRGW